MSDNVLQQNLSQTAEPTGAYPIYFLFEEKGPLPNAEILAEHLRPALGDIDVISNGAVKTFALLNHKVAYEDNHLAPCQLMLSDYLPFNESDIGALERTQLWNLPNADDLLAKCKYKILANDFMALGLAYMQRANILIGYVDILLSLLPQCKAIYFAKSGNLVPPHRLQNPSFKGPARFLQGGINVRFFNVQNSNDKLVDSLGLYALGQPDIQIHFKDADPNIMINYVYNLALYQFENNFPIQSGHTVDAARELGNELWKCQYEEALIQPARVVLDVEAGPYAAGTRGK